MYGSAVCETPTVWDMGLQGGIQIQYTQSSFQAIFGEAFQAIVKFSVQAWPIDFHSRCGSLAYTRIKDHLIQMAYPEGVWADLWKTKMFFANTRAR